MRDTPPLFVALGDSIDQAVRELGVPGAAIALVDRDSVLWMRGFGVDDVASRRPISPQTKFRVGSISKTLVGLGVLALIEEAQLDIDSPVDSLAPELGFRNPWHDANPVRVVNLLEHTSGIEDVHFREVYDLRDGRLRSEPVPLGDVLAMSPATRTVRWPPGTHVAYSNHGYTVVGYLLERITGESLERYLHRTILDPLKMNHSTFWNTGSASEHASTGHTSDGRVYPYVPMLHRPASSLETSVEDLAKLIRFFLNRGRVDGVAVLDSARITRMETSTSGLIARAGHHRGYGIGNRARYWRGHRYQGHGGGLPDFSTVFGYFPDLGVGFAIALSCGDGDALAVLSRRVLEVLVPEPESFEPTSIALSDEIGRSYAGRYQFANPERSLDALPNILLGGFEVTWHADTLFTQEMFGEREALVPVSETLFRRERDPYVSVVFARREDGRLILGEPLDRAEYVRVANWIPVVHRAIVIAMVIVLVSIAVHALIWLPAWLVRGLRRGRWGALHRASRLWSLLTVLCLAGIGISLAAWTSDPIRAGIPTFASVAFTTATWLMVALSPLALITAIGEWRSGGHPLATTYRLVAAAACVGMTIYLAGWGLIGLRLWSY